MPSPSRLFVSSCLVGLTTFAAGCGAGSDSAGSAGSAAVTASAAKDGGVSDGGAGDGSAMSCDVRDYGAVGDGKTLDTKAIQAAIDACAGHGGEVHIQEGTYLSGTITLKSSMTFHVHGGGTLLGTQDGSQYPELSPWQWTNNSQISNTQRAFVFAHGASNLHITGTGIIDGNGTSAEWTTATVSETVRPMAMYLLQGDNVTVDGITIKDSAMWSMVNMELTHLSISGITVDSQVGRTRDGIDIVDCQHVTVDSVTVTSEDDSLCVKSGLPIGVDDVTFSNSKVVRSGVANALKIGTASYGPITNITFDTITVGGAGKAAMAVEAIDGANVSNVAFKNITFTDVGTPFFVVVGDRQDKPSADPVLIGSVTGLSFENITGTSTQSAWGSTITGLVEDGKTYPVKNVSFTNVNVSFLGDSSLTSVPAVPVEYDLAHKSTYPDPGTLFGDVPAWGIFFRHVDTVSFTDTVFTLAGADVRPMFGADDVTSVGAPSSTVTFVVHTAAGAPALAAGATLAITGATTEPPYVAVASDPLGDWGHVSAGVALTPTASDPTTYTGQATVPQGATLAYKAIAVSDGKTTYERASAGNRTATIPAASSATIEIDWQN